MRVVNIRPKQGHALILGAVPLILLLLLYLVVAANRHALNPADKILPTPQAMVAAMSALVGPDPMSGQRLFWSDTAASLQRLGLGLIISTVSALLVGMVIGLIPAIRATFSPVVTTIAVIPPIALLPILFIVLGLGETAKVALIVIGILPLMIRDIAAQVETLPAEQMLKAQTLGANSWQLALRVALPQAMPRLIQAVRLSLGPAWVFLISAEAIASDVGLGYRIFLVRRYLSMDIIIPYVIWIALIAIVVDWALNIISQRGFAWAHAPR
jgi:NitT/TauT family transport system permease protein